ncbi:hypothetical protein [Pararhizobium sp. IMCC21322]|uniref:hypothetical protein n=1 Tax=Pararhizobium sp. IMCC21322 TaxID=3067903 RepID=UPI0027406B84|nr:hypothetical protein [Pararhizobium sp. IMCC21322]
MPSIKFAGKSFNLPQSQLARISLGVVFVLFGFVGFLPIVGFWMIPVGLIILSYDVPSIRRGTRRIAVWWGRKRQERQQKRK